MEDFNWSLVLTGAMTRRWKEFQNIQFQIEIDRSDKQLDERDAFEEKILDIVSEAMRLLSICSITNAPSLPQESVEGRTDGI